MTQGKVLVLGSGLVAAPLVRYLAGRGYELGIGSIEPESAEKMAEGLENVTVFFADVADEEATRARVAEYDLVISLVPWQFHPTVAKACLEHKKHLVTPSYISDQMAALDGDAKENGLVFLNELGLDPGIDHMSAMSIIDRIKGQGGTITGFASYCGGLPAPENAENPLGYKFSWSPKGVFMAAISPARYLKDGQVVEVPGDSLFSHCHALTVGEVGIFEAYPNRDSLKYIDIYGLQGVRTMYRGTLRYEGWCRLMRGLIKMRVLDPTPVRGLDALTYAQAVGSRVDVSGGNLSQRVVNHIGYVEGPEVISAIKWMGLLDDTPIPRGTTSMLDAMVDLLQGRLNYEKDERDMIVLVHDFTYELDGETKRLRSTMIDFGVPGQDTAMSRTVGLPAAIGADLIMQGRISSPGVHAPVTSDIYTPILEKLAETGVKFEERG